MRLYCAHMSVCMGVRRMWVYECAWRCMFVSVDCVSVQVCVPVHGWVCVVCQRGCGCVWWHCVCECMHCECMHCTCVCACACAWACTPVTALRARPPWPTAAGLFAQLLAPFPAEAQPASEGIEFPGSKTVSEVRAIADPGVPGCRSWQLAERQISFYSRQIAVGEMCPRSFFSVMQLRAAGEGATSATKTLLILEPWCRRWGAGSPQPPLETGGGAAATWPRHTAGSGVGASLSAGRRLSRGR